ncbi:Protein CBG27875 [Caenorhabditis briggsae]|uniref:Protein CBG27875 n=1 Tax=Caenorhabditis briggsae TaxID=6238 RepID=B6IEH0_CAEBR|nr:Protein CBG27875 [Caenorhabditis briggsae]CAR98300.1 Protein CBG27875 [Caenorhabditis briggsae]
MEKIKSGDLVTIPLSFHFHSQTSKMENRDSEEEYKNLIRRNENSNLESFEI